MRIDQTKIVIPEKRFSPVQGLMLAVIVCYTAALTISYRYYLIRVFPEYSYDFSYLKLLNGVIAIMVLAFAMDFSSEKPSQFFSYAPFLYWDNPIGNYLLYAECKSNLF